MLSPTNVLLTSYTLVTVELIGVNVCVGMQLAREASKKTVKLTQLSRDGVLPPTFLHINVLWIFIHLHSGLLPIDVISIIFDEPLVRNVFLHFN